MRKLLSDFRFDVEDICNAHEKGEVDTEEVIVKIRNLCFFFLSESYREKK